MRMRVNAICHVRKRAPPLFAPPDRLSPEARAVVKRIAKANVEARK